MSCALPHYPCRDRVGGDPLSRPCGPREQHVVPGWGESEVFPDGELLGAVVAWPKGFESEKCSW